MARVSRTKKAAAPAAAENNTTAPERDGVAPVSQAAQDVGPLPASAGEEASPGLLSTPDLQPDLLTAGTAAATFVGDINGGDPGNIRLQVTPGRTTRVGGRRWVAGEVQELTPLDVTVDQLTRILDEPGFVFAWVRMGPLA